MAPVTAHYGRNNVAQYCADPQNPSALIGGCTLEQPEKIVYIDELDENDNVYLRMDAVKQFAQPNAKKIKPEMEWLADGTVLLTFCFPAEKKIAEAAAIECAKRMNLKDISVISKEVLHRAEGTRIELKGKVDFDIDIDQLVIPAEPDVLSDEELQKRHRAESPCAWSAAPSARTNTRWDYARSSTSSTAASRNTALMCTISAHPFLPEKLVGAAIELNADAMPRFGHHLA